MLPSKYGTFVYSKCPVKFPEQMTNAAWQKKKSIADKAFKGGTGLGDALKSAATAFDAVTFERLEFNSARMKPETIEGYVGHKKVAEAELNLVSAAQKKLLAAKTLAKTTSDDKGLSKDARKFALDLEQGLADTERWLNSIDLTDFDDAIKILEAKAKAKAAAEEEKFKRIRDQYKSLAKVFDDALVALRTSPTLDELAKQNVGGKSFDLLEAAETLKKFGGDQYAPFVSDARKKYEISKDANHRIRSEFDNRDRVANRDLIKKAIEEYVAKFK